MTPDVIVVGGGVVGCACAFDLATAGLRVLLLERAGLAAGASGRNQGLLLPPAVPRFQALFREGLARYQRLAEEGAVPFGLRPLGYLLLAADEPTMATARGCADSLVAGGFSAEVLECGQLRALEPSLAPDLVGGVRVEGAFAVDPAVVTLAWADAARRAGAEVRTHSEVRRILVEGDRAVGVLTDAGTLAAGTVVVAAGPWTRRLAGTAGVDLPVSGARGWLLQTAPLPWRMAHALEEAVWPGLEGTGVHLAAPTLADLAAEPPTDQAGSTAFTLQQGPAGHATVGASLAASLREDPERPETVQGLARRALRFLPQLAKAPVIATWSGVRPVTPDGNPLVGPVPGVEGLWVVSGHGPEGVLLAPSSARMLAAHLAGGRPDPDAVPFHPGRFVEAGGARGQGRA